MAIARGIERLADGADAPVHHVGRRDDVGTGLGLDQRLHHQPLDRCVVDDLLALHDAVMAVAGIGVERHIGDEADVRHRRLDGAQRLADEVLRIERLGADVVAQLRVGVGEKRDRRNAEIAGAADFGDDAVDRLAHDARHGGHRLGLRLVGQEQRPDQVVDGERRLAHQAARPGRAAVAAHAPAAEDRIHVRPGGGIGLERRRLAGHGGPVGGGSRDGSLETYHLLPCQAADCRWQGRRRRW